MAILNIFSPGWLNGDTATQYVPNPWGTSDVWVQCTVPALQVNDSVCLGGFGIIEVVSLDGQGNPRSSSSAIRTTSIPWSPRTSCPGCMCSRWCRSPWRISSPT